MAIIMIFSLFFINFIYLTYYFEYHLLQISQIFLNRHLFFRPNLFQFQKNCLFNLIIIFIIIDILGFHRQF